jgi:hypothetical protein
VRPASRPTSPNSGTSGEDDRRRSNAEFKWSRKCVGFEVGRSARRSERELLVLFDTECRRLFGTENSNGSRVAWNSASNGFRYMQGLINETFHYHFGMKGRVVLVLRVVSYHDYWLLDFRRRKMSPCETLSVIEVIG